MSRLSAALVLGALIGVGVAVLSTSTGDRAAVPASLGVGQEGEQAANTLEVEVASVQAADPIGIRIPGIGVEAATSALGLQNDGSIEVPEDFDATGWWRDGPEPGEVGAAVILGHVDSFSGPAVFFDLHAMSPGDTIHVDRADGTTVSYVVDRIEQHGKDQFPTDDVYGKTEDSQLRLVTCGGVFDHGARSYDDNLIVFASAV